MWPRLQQLLIGQTCEDSSFNLTPADWLKIHVVTLDVGKKTEKV